MSLFEMNNCNVYTEHVVTQMSPIQQDGTVSIRYYPTDKKIVIIDLNAKVGDMYQFKLRILMPRNASVYFKYWECLNAEKNRESLQNMITSVSICRNLEKKFSLSSNSCPDNYHPDKSKIGWNYDEKYTDRKNHFITKCALAVSVPEKDDEKDERGWGIVFQGKNENSFIPAGSVIGEYCGKIISLQQKRKRYHEWKENEENKGLPDAYTLALDDPFKDLDYNDNVPWYIDAREEGSLMRFVNHSCDPNCEYKTVWINGFIRAFVVAIKRISYVSFKKRKYAPELTVMYCKTEDLGFECRCKICKKDKKK